MSKKIKKEKKQRAPRVKAQIGMLVRPYKGIDYSVESTGAGFIYEGETYKSLTAVAQKITGYKAISGPAFFKVAKQEAAV